MTQYNTLNEKLSNSIKMECNKKWTEVTLNLWSNIIGDSIVGNNFPHKLLLTNTQNLKLRKTFANNSLANIKLSKTQL